MFVRIRDINYHYLQPVEDSPYPILLMLHGFMGAAGSFSHLADELGNFCNPVLIDMIGHGSTDAPDNPERYKLNQQLLDLSELISSRHFSPCYILGYSMGGRLALRFALDYPDLVSGLILESTTYGIENTNEQKERRHLDSKRADSIVKDFRSFVEEWNKMPILRNKAHENDYLFESNEQLQRNQKPAGIANSLIGFGTGTMDSARKRLPELKVPTLLIAGQKDEKYTNLAVEMHNLIPNSQIKIHPEAGHRVHLDQPDRYLSCIREFLDRDSLET